MIVLKSIISWALLGMIFVLYFFALIPVFLLTFWFDKHRRIANNVFMTIGTPMLWATPAGKVSIKGTENYDPKRPTICIANHSSFLDMPLSAKLPWKMKWISKKEMFYLPVAGWLIWMTGHVFINRKKKTGFKKLEAAVPALKALNPIMIFPEGTRSLENRPFRKGAFFLAYDHHIHVLPIVLKGTGATLPPKEWKFRAGHDLSIEVLPYVDPQEFDSVEDLADHCQRLIHAHL